jgi:hypothetical protein
MVIGILSVTSVADGRIWWLCTQIKQELDVLDRLKDYDSSPGSEQYHQISYDNIVRQKAELLSLGVQYDETSKEPLYDKTDIEADFRRTTGIKGLQTIDVRIISLSGNYEQVAVESQGNLYDRLTDSLGNAIDTSMIWREHDVHVAVFAGHGLVKNEVFCLYVEVSQRSDETIKYFPISNYWEQWWEFVITNNFCERHVVIVLDMCHSGAVLHELDTWLSINKNSMKERKCSITIQAACVSEEFARGNYFLSTWLSMLESGKKPDLDSDVVSEVNSMSVDSLDQHPCFQTTLSVSNGWSTLNGLKIPLLADAKGLHAAWRSRSESHIKS